MTYQFHHQFTDSKKDCIFNVRVEEGYSILHGEIRYFVFINDSSRMQVAPEQYEGKTEREIAEYAFNRWVKCTEILKAKHRG